MINPEITEEQCLKRIAECQTVINEVENTEAWSVINRDLTMYMESIDANWHRAPEDKLPELRVTKFAIEHIKNLVEGYRIDLKSAMESLEKIQNPESNMSKDFDTESFNEVEQ